MRDCFLSIRRPEYGEIVIVYAYVRACTRTYVKNNWLIPGYKEQELINVLISSNVN